MIPENPLSNPNSKELALRGKNHKMNMVFDKSGAFFMFSRPIQKDESLLEQKNLRTEMEMSACESVKYRLNHTTISLTKEAMSSMFSALLYYGFHTGSLTETMLNGWIEQSKLEVIKDKESQMSL